MANEPEPMLSVEDAQERLLSAVGEPLPGEKVVKSRRPVSTMARPASVATSTTTRFFQSFMS